MESGLLWASVALGVIVFLARFVSPRSVAAGEDAPPNRFLNLVALLVPFAGFLLTLPTHGAFFHPGGMLGAGFLLGGIGAWAATVTSRRTRADAAILTAGNIGLATALAAIAQLFLRVSLIDALLGVAIGWFCVAVALYLATPPEQRGDAITQTIAAGAGAAAGIVAASCFGTLRDGITPELAKGTWGGALTVFAAFGALLIAGARFLPVGGGKWSRWLPFLILLLGAGAGIYLLCQKYGLDPKFAYAGIAGIGALGVGRWVLAADKGNNLAPVVTFLLLLGGFTAAMQTLQGVGASAFVLGVWLAYGSVAVSGSSSSEGTDQRPTPNTLLLPLFATSLLLFRLFTTRWEEELRGVSLTDSYALFGFIVGGLLPSLLAAVAGRGRKGWAGVAGLAAAAALTLAVPAAVVVLFGAKAVSALMIGLAVGRVALTPRSSVLAALMAVGAGLALVQFFGTILPPEEWTRAEKVRALGGIVLVGLAAVATATFLNNRAGDAGREEEA